MKISEKVTGSAGGKWAAALAVNALFLAGALLVMTPVFEANDDLTLAAFVDGQMAAKCAYIPYINYMLALLLKGIYTLLGEGAAWHTIGQYALLFCAFTAISRVLFERQRAAQAALVSVIMLLFFGVDCYMLISYTKTAAVCTVGGMALLFMAVELKPKGKRALPGAMGIFLCLFGFMLRKMEFLPCMAIMAVLGLRWLYKLLFQDKGSAKEKLLSLWRYAAPFLLMLALAAGLYAADEYAWSRGEWKEYSRFDAVRVAYSDYGRPAYEEMPESYDAMGITENAATLLEQGNYFDPEIFTSDVMAQISAEREKNFPPPSLGECLGRLLDDCMPAFFRQLHIYGFLAVLILWLCAGEHDLRGWLTLAGVGGLFALFYLYLIYRGRYMVDRVDVGLFLAMFAALAWTLRPERLANEKVILTGLMLLSVFFSFWLCREKWIIGREGSELIETERAGVARILEDEEHVYLAKLGAVNDGLYSPFEPAPAGYWDKIILLGGWVCKHPAIMATLREYGVTNPYRDAVGNEKVYFIDDEIELTLGYLREYYAPDATAERVEPLSTETGFAIYRIKNGEEEGNA